jgi:interferon, gamma-inducible protein 30
MIDRYPKLKEHFPFINCTMSNIQKDIIDMAQECLQFSNVSFNQLAYDCANQTRGNALLYKAGYETNNLNPKLNYVPWINLNGEHSINIQNEAEEDLIKFICTNHKDATKINVCNNGSSFFKSNFLFILLLSLLIVIF